MQAFDACELPGIVNERDAEAEGVRGDQHVERADLLPLALEARADRGRLRSNGTKGLTARGERIRLERPGFVAGARSGRRETKRAHPGISAGFAAN
jgi:hypothetical protein